MEIISLILALSLQVYDTLRQPSNKIELIPILSNFLDRNDSILNYFEEINNATTNYTIVNDEYCNKMNRTLFSYKVDDEDYHNGLAVFTNLICNTKRISMYYTNDTQKRLQNIDIGEVRKCVLNLAEPFDRNMIHNCSLYKQQYQCIQDIHKHIANSTVTLKGSPLINELPKIMKNLMPCLNFTRILAAHEVETTECLRDFISANKKTCKTVSDINTTIKSINNFTNNKTNFSKAETIVDFALVEDKFTAFATTNGTKCIRAVGKNITDCARHNVGTKSNHTRRVTTSILETLLYLEFNDTQHCEQGSRMMACMETVLRNNNTCTASHLEYVKSIQDLVYNISNCEHSVITAGAMTKKTSSVALRIKAATSIVVVLTSIVVIVNLFRP